MDRRIDYVRCLVSCFVEMISILQCLKCWKWAIPFNNRTPPIEDTCFRFMTPEEFHAMECLPLRNSMPWNVYPCGIPQHEMSTPEEFHAIKCLSRRNSMLILLYPWGIPLGFPSSFNPTLEELQAHFTLPMRNSMLIWPYPWGIPRSSIGGGVHLLNGIAHI